MNIFYDDHGIIGKAEPAYLRNTTEDFLELTKAIKNKLGKQAYLLDKYLYDLLNAINCTTVFDTAEDGSEIMGELVGLCRKVFEGDTSEEKHPLYAKVKEYISTHPLPYQETATKVSLYCMALLDDFMGYGIDTFSRKRRMPSASIWISFICMIYIEKSMLSSETKSRWKS